MRGRDSRTGGCVGRPCCRRARRDGLRAAAASITPTGGAEIDVFAANAGDRAAAACVSATLGGNFGGLDILVNNAATSPYMGRMIDIDLPRFDKTYEVNLQGVRADPGGGPTGRWPGKVDT